LEQLTDRFSVGDVAANEVIAWIMRDIREALRVAGVGQFVEIEDFDVTAGVEKKAYEVRTDKPRSACDEKFQSRLPF
jgi:hypothetical protein